MRQRYPKKARANWLISDKLWREIEPLLPQQKISIRGGPRIANRRAMEGIFFILRTGSQWKSLDVTSICSASVAHRQFQFWRETGVFKAMWIKALERYDKLKGIDWRWLSMDTCSVKSPVAGSKKLVKTLRTEGNEASSAAS